MEDAGCIKEYDEEGGGRYFDEDIFVPQRRDISFIRVGT